MRKSALPLGVALALFSLVLPPAVSAFYSGNCTGDAGTNQLHGYVPFQTSVHLDYVTAVATSWKPVAACTPFNNQGGASWVFAANLQGNAFVQLGWGTAESGVGEDWMYTPDETSSGQVVPPGGAHTLPISGHSYKFTVQWNGTKWSYYVLDKTTSTSPFSALGVNNTRNWGNFTWYGFESHDRNSQYGGAGSSIYLTDLGYSTSTSSTVTYLFNTGRVHCCGMVESWDHDGVVNLSGQHTEVWAYTSSHS